MPSLSDNEVKIKISTQADNSGIVSAEKSYNSLTSSVAAGNAIWDVTKNSLIGIKNAVTGFVQNAADVEMLRTSLDVLTGSAESGKNMFSALYTMAARTPFETTDLVGATKVMLGYGIAQEKITDTLSMLGDVAMGDKNKLSGLALSYSQVQSTGKLMGQDLLQMINAGFNPLGVIAQKTGKSMSKLKDEMSAGAITADMVTEAFKTATSQGGLYYQGMDKGSKTLNGTWSTLQDNIGMITRKLVGMSETGEIVQNGLFDRIADGINNANTWLTENQTTVDEWSKKFSDGMSIAWEAGAKVFTMIIDFAGWAYANKDWVLPIVEGLIAMKAAFMITGIVNAATVAVQTFAIAISTPMAVAAIGVGAIVAVYDATQKALGALEALKGSMAGNASVSEDLRQKYMSVKASGASKEEVDKYYKLYQNALTNQINISNQAAGIRLFSSGGYTGQGGVNEVAGIVHKGEYVIPKSQVDQSTGLPKASSGGIVINNTNYFNRESDSTAYVRELGYMLSRA